MTSMAQNPTKFINLEGVIKKLETSLHLRKWTKYYACFEDECLAFYRGRDKSGVPESTLDLTFITSLKMQGYSYVGMVGKCIGDFLTFGQSTLRPNPKEDEQFQIEVQSAGNTTYLLFETKEEQNRWFTALKYCMDHYMADTPHGSTPGTMGSAPESYGSTNEKDALFVISNSEKRNQEFLKGYYAMKRAASSLAAQSQAQRSNATDGPDKRASAGVTAPSSGQDPAERIRKLEELVKQLVAEREQQDKVEQSLRAQLIEKENEFKKKEAELISSFESKRKSFSFIVSSKDQEIEKLKHETQAQFAKKIQMLEEQLMQKDKEITELKQRMSDKELELLELREKEFEKTTRLEQTMELALKDSQKKVAELSDQLSALSDRHFFTLAMQVKVQTNNNALDLNSLYEEAKREKVPFTQWQAWITQKSKESGGVMPVAINEDERDDVSGF